MSRELIFLVSAHRDDSEVALEGPARIKVPGQNPNPAVAFPNELLGRQFISGRGLERDCLLKPARDLDADDLARVKSLPILLFERPDQLIEYLADGERFNYSLLTFSYEQAAQRVAIIP